MSAPLLPHGTAGCYKRCRQRPAGGACQPCRDAEAADKRRRRGSRSANMRQQLLDELVAERHQPTPPPALPAISPSQGTRNLDELQAAIDGPADRDRLRSVRRSA